MCCYFKTDLYNSENKSFKNSIDSDKDSSLFETEINKVFWYEFNSYEEDYDKHLHLIFSEYFFKVVVGVKIWNKEVIKKKPSELMSVSDEALVYLIYENNRYVWLKIIKMRNYKKVQEKPKYTTERGEIFLIMIGQEKDW